jgi:amino acid adenylation domain-containing protein
MRHSARDVVDGFLAAAATHPDRPAIARAGQELSYAELRAAALAIAGRLGHRPGAVGVPATHSPGTLTSLLGVWAAGGVYCPVDPDYPGPRQQAMLAAAGCRSLLAPVDPFAEPPLVEPPQPFRGAGGDRPEPDELAYILFTSGSTGAPKPVLTPRRAIAVAVAALRGLFGLTAADRVLQFASLNWDTCFEEILPTLTSGACLVFDDAAHQGSFPRWLRMLDRTGTTIVNLPTAYWHELVSYLDETGAPLPERLRLVVIGGEAVNPTRLARWRKLDTARVRLLNTYGCTETTLITHAVDLHGPLAHPLDEDRGVPIGRPLPHVVERVTRTGELLVSGPGLAAGYRGQPRLTAARFVTIAGRRYFRTGDRVSRRGDGTLGFDGRIDDEIKIRGIRVDPAEVEAQVAGYPGVAAVAVAGVQLAGRTVLAAYVVVRPGTVRDGLAGRIAGYLRERVPAHLIPSRISLVPHLIHTATGKVDRNRVKEVYYDAPAAG